MSGSANSCCGYEPSLILEFDVPQASVTLSADGHVLVTAEGCTSATAAPTDSTIKVWSLRTGELVNSWSYPSTTYNREADRIYSLALTSDNRVLVTGSHLIKIWNVNTGEEIRTLKGERWAFYVAISLDNEILVTSSGSKTVVWKLPRSKRIRRVFSHSDILCPAMSSDGLMLADVDSFAQTVKIWDSVTGKTLRVLDMKGAIKLRQLSFSPDGQLLAGGGDDGIRIWDINTGQQIQTINKFQNVRFHRHLDIITDTAFALENKTVFSTGSDGYIQFWDVTTGKNVGTLRGKNLVGSMLVSKDSQIIAGIVGGKLNARIVEVWSRADVRSQNPRC